MPNVAIFSDLDGCLLNKEDYRFDAALPVLDRIKRTGIPLILASSKTETEMRRLADDMQLDDAPLVCENGGVIFWSRNDSSEDNRVLLGAERREILQILASLKTDFQFESFEDMGIEGVMRTTDLPRDRAAAALRRDCTEPLKWHDDDEKIEEFGRHLTAKNLTLTRGGRFWHVAGQTDKGKAVARIVSRMEDDASQSFVTIGVGDSPIDQGLLNTVTRPIAIPQPNGLVGVEVEGDNSRIARKAGAAGWADTVSDLLDELGVAS